MFFCDLNTSYIVDSDEMPQKSIFRLSLHCLVRKVLRTRYERNSFVINTQGRHGKLAQVNGILNGADLEVFSMRKI